MTRPDPKYNRILLTRMKFIGDILLTTPVIRSVRNAFPRATIAYLGDSRGVSLLKHNPSLDEILGYDFSRPSLREQASIAVQLRRRKFDLVIDFFGNPRSALLTYLSGAPVRVGLDRKWRGRMYTIRVKDDGRPKSAIEFHFQLLRAAGITPSASKTEIFLTDEERSAAQAFLAKGSPPITAGRRMVGVHPGATWPAKRWPAERFGALLDRIQKDLDAQVFLTAGPGEDAIVREVLSHSRQRHRVLASLPLRELSACISFCSAFVSNDAAPMHIAAALGIPTVGIFGPGEENIWFPYRTDLGHRALRKDVPCHPCHLDFCNRKGDGYMECMKLLTIHEVLEAVREALERRGGSGSRNQVSTGRGG